jgi:hypothetical protein
LFAAICVMSLIVLSVEAVGASVAMTTRHVSVVPKASISLLQSFSIAVSYLTYVAT